MTIRPRVTGLLGLATASVLLLGACAGIGGGTAPSPSHDAETEIEPTADPTPATSEPKEPADPLALIGMWRVSGAEGADASTYISFDTYQIILWRECGYLMGSWSVAGDALLGEVGGGSPTCFADDGVLPVPWLDNTREFRNAGDGTIELRDAAGRPTATLDKDGTPASRQDIVDSLAAPPVITDVTRAWLSPAAALPDDVTAATDLVGRWLPTETTDDDNVPGVTSDPYAEFASDGSYIASDGCNGGMGRWALRKDGVLLSTSGASTLMMCPGAAVPSWIATAKTVSSGSTADGVTTVTLWDSEGVALGTLVRE
ncbi:MAG: hypothetical protein JWQ43_2476 [Glaciihabitans sp.]|nr:hypothetical protein [Glaciihabitans sp.]